MTIWDRLSVSNPVNRTAGVVVSRSSGLHPEGSRAKRLTWDAPPITIPYRPTGTGSIDLTGHRFGWFTVVGFLGKTGTGKGAPSQWLVRCKCGRYEGRKAKSVKSALNAEDRCYECQHLRHLQFRNSSVAAQSVPRINHGDEK